MMDFTANWGWPQWVVAIGLFASFAIDATQHGKPKLHTAGDEAGKPYRYNGFVGLSRITLWSAVLICGGFFQ